MRKDDARAQASRVGRWAVTDGLSRASPAAKDAKPEKSDEEQKAEQQKAWRERLQKTNEEITRLGAEAERLQAAVDGNGNFFSATRANLVTQLDQAKAQLAQAKQTLSELEDEGRRNLYR